MTPTQQQWRSGPDVIGHFADTYDATTSRGRVPHTSQRPVLAYVPDYGDMHLAASYARNRALAVVESRAEPLIGWAMEVQAVDLTTGAVTVDTRSPEQRRELERIHDYGNNGWTRGFGADRSTFILGGLLGQDGIDGDIVLGYMVARGHDGRSVARLAKIIENVR
ncbi:hypothetical protein [Streptomyces apocyni]|uniref:hypothetical protein n=1 Tax=Streptomyces apocyni TaxID=2654677 RepID=UPI0012EA9180|nr:hypothetical protein [Streptomyces apocyni]